MPVEYFQVFVKLLLEFFSCFDFSYQTGVFKQVVFPEYLRLDEACTVLPFPVFHQFLELKNFFFIEGDCDVASSFSVFFFRRFFHKNLMIFLLLSSL